MITLDDVLKRVELLETKQYAREFAEVAKTPENPIGRTVEARLFDNKTNLRILEKKVAEMRTLPTLNVRMRLLEKKVMEIVIANSAAATSAAHGRAADAIIDDTIGYSDQQKRDIEKLADPQGNNGTTFEEVESITNQLKGLQTGKERICTECNHSVTNNGLNINSCAYVNYRDPLCKRHRNISTGVFMRCEDARNSIGENSQPWYGPNASDCGREGKFWTPKANKVDRREGPCTRRIKAVPTHRMEMRLNRHNDRRKGGDV